MSGEFFKQVSHIQTNSDIGVTFFAVEITIIFLVSAAVISELYFHCFYTGIICFKKTIRLQSYQVFLS